MSTTSESSHKFQTETQKVLKIIINSLYQHKEVFLRELVSNASDALNKVRLKLLTSEKIYEKDFDLNIQLIPDKEKNTLTIRDSGIGMSQKFMDNIFTPFSQEDSGQRREYEGNGLGLALVKKYSEINGAAIKVQSRKDVGSVFAVLVPRKRKIRNTTKILVDAPPTSMTFMAFSFQAFMKCLRPQFF